MTILFANLSAYMPLVMVLVGAGVIGLLAYLSKKSKDPAPTRQYAFHEPPPIPVTTTRREDYVAIRCYATSEESLNAGRILEDEGIDSKTNVMLSGPPGMNYQLLVPRRAVDSISADLPGYEIIPEPETLKSSHEALKANAELSVEEVSEEVAEQREKEQRPKSGVWTLVITLALFVGLGLFQISLLNLGILVLVLTIHEMGHFIGMKLFGYRDVRMFFIPLFGAAVSGRDSRPNGTKDVIVSLLGPLPGMAIGIVCAIAHLRYGGDALLMFARAFLFINGFNLLPLHPLDGGRVVDRLIFSRHPKLEAAFKLLAALALGYMAYLFKWFFLGLLAFFLLTSLKITYMQASIAKDLKKEIDDDENLDPEDIPEKYVDFMMPRILSKLPAPHKTAKMVAAQARGIWRRSCDKPPSIFATIVLLAIYLIALPVGVLTPLIFEGAVMHLHGELEEIVPNETTP